VYLANLGPHHQATKIIISFNKKDFFIAFRSALSRQDPGEATANNYVVKCFHDVI
jgi:hypothetical protein